MSYTETPLTKYIHVDNTGTKEIVGRSSLDIAQLGNINILLPPELIKTRQYGLEFWNGRDEIDPYKWNRETYFRKTYTIYMMGCFDRKYKTTPVKFRSAWDKAKNFVTRINRSMFENSAAKFCVKGHTLSLNWCADMDKIMNLGPEGWYFTLTRHSLRAFQNNVYANLASAKKICRAYVKYLSTGTDYIFSSGVCLKMTPLQMWLFSLDSFNAELSRIAMHLPEDVRISSGYLEDMRFSIFWRSELESTWGSQASDYYDKVIPMFWPNGFNLIP